MATVSVVQSISGSSASATSLTVTLGSTPSTSDFVIAVITCASPITGLSNAGSLFLGGTTTSPVLSAYRWAGGGTALKSLTVTQQTSGPISVYYFELSSACTSTILSMAGFNTSTPSLSATTPTTWLVSTGDLPLAFFTSQPASTATARSGWTNLATLNSSVGYVLNAQSGPVATANNQTYTGSVTWAATNPAGEGIIISANQADQALSSQMVLEALGKDTALGRSSQMQMDVIGTDTAKAHTSQMEADVIGSDTALARVSQIYIELVCPQYVHVSQDVLEAIAKDTAKVRTSQMVCEVLFSSQGLRRRTTEDELFTY